MNADIPNELREAIDLATSQIYPWIPEVEGEGTAEERQDAYDENEAHIEEANRIREIILGTVAPMLAANNIVSIPASLHPDTKSLVVRFAAALAEKLHKAEQKYGYSDGWKSDGWIKRGECAKRLREHTEKGDPRDVAAYCAFLWHHGAGTNLPAEEIPEITNFEGERGDPIENPNADAYGFEPNPEIAAIIEAIVTEIGRNTTPSPDNSFPSYGHYRGFLCEILARRLAPLSGNLERLRGEEAFWRRAFVNSVEEHKRCTQAGMIEKITAAVPYPALCAGTADAIAFDIEQGADAKNTTTPAAKAAWLRSIAKQLRELERARPPGGQTP